MRIQTNRVARPSPTTRASRLRIPRASPDAWGALVDRNDPSPVPLLRSRDVEIANANKQKREVLKPQSIALPLAGGGASIEANDIGRAGVL